MINHEKCGNCAKVAIKKGKRAFTLFRAAYRSYANIVRLVKDSSVSIQQRLSQKNHHHKGGSTGA